MRRTSSRKPRPADPPRRPTGWGKSGGTSHDDRSTPATGFHHYEMEYDVSHGYSSDRSVIIR